MLWLLENRWHTWWHVVCLHQIVLTGRMKLESDFYFAWLFKTQKAKREEIPKETLIANQRGTLSI